MSKKKEQLIFKECLTLFVDILGFKEMVNQSIDDHEVVTKISRAIELVKQLGQKQPWAKTKTATQFSDCIVVSYQIDEHSAVFDMINEIGFMLIDQANHGILMRGALVVGPLIHSKKYIFGKAMNDAYQLESKVAKYPRVIISPEVLKVAEKAHAKQHSGTTEVEIIKKFLKTDCDGLLFIDYISWESVVATIGMEQDSYGGYLGNLAKIIESGLNNGSASVQSKYLWLLNKYLLAIDLIEQLPDDHPWVLENFDIYQYISTLPKFHKEALSASDNILKFTAGLN